MENLSFTAGARCFFVGIGGIGMSGLAQMLRWMGCQVAGSDRGLTESGKASLYDALEKKEIALYPQDGSGILEFHPDFLIVSTAVEEGNPDLLEATKSAIPVLHRAKALASALRQLKIPLIAIAGSCGKTSVTAWIASALHALKEPILMVNGGYLVEFEDSPGNFHADSSPHWAVVEVDESDKSIREFSPDYGVLLNVGDDHYSREELCQVFGAFLNRCQCGAAVFSELQSLVPNQIPIRFFGGAADDGIPEDHPVNYAVSPHGMSFDIPKIGTVFCGQSGFHSALNACAVFALLRLLPLSASLVERAGALGAFRGVQQRFEFLGWTDQGVPVINDYAHNPEKLAAAISAARERYGSPLLMAFQPHGFTPLRFMREALKEQLRNVLQKTDRFCFLPVFYAGGTASFQPTSDEVAEEFAAESLPVFAGNRNSVETLLFQEKPSALLIMGARDSSLRPWGLSLAHRANL